MQTQTSHQPNPLGRITDIAMMFMSLAVAITTLLMIFAPSSIGSDNPNTGPDKLSAVPAQAGVAKEAPAEPAHRASDSPTRPMCAEPGGIASTQEIERTDEGSGTVGCGVRGNLASGAPASNHSEKRVDVATFLTWHAEARDLVQSAYQPSLSGPSPTEAKDDRRRRR